MILLFTILFTSIAYSSAKIDVAIIGGGIGGGSAAFFLNEMLPGEFKIDLFEADKIGGRLATFEYDGHFYETGGSIIHSKNLLMKQFVEKFGLEARLGCSDEFGIFNGTELLFKSNHYDILTALKLWWRYGSDILRLDNYNSHILNLFQRIYELDKFSDYPFNTTNELLSHVSEDLMTLLTVSTYEGLLMQDFSKRFVEELVACIIRCNYCQSLNVHLFVGSVAVAGAGAELWSVKGGNWQVAERLINASGANVRYDKVVAVYTIDETSKLLLCTKTEDRYYDYIIVAAPLTNKTNIGFYGFDNADYFFNARYHKTVCTLVKGEINESFFNMEIGSMPRTILFTDNFFVNAIAKINPVDDDCSPDSLIWKIFSDEELTDTQLDLLFHNYSVIYVKDWLAYPEYGSIGINKSFYPFNNYPNLLYVNAIEALASAMEMSAIGGHNVASLIVRSLNKDISPNYTFTFTHIHDEF